MDPYRLRAFDCVQAGPRAFIKLLRQVHLFQWRELVKSPDFLLNILEIFFAFKLPPQIHIVKIQNLRVKEVLFIVFPGSSAKDPPPEPLKKIHGAVRKFRNFLPGRPWIIQPENRKHNGAGSFSPIFVNIVKFNQFIQGNLCLCSGTGKKGAACRLLCQGGKCGIRKHPWTEFPQRRPCDGVLFPADLFWFQRLLRYGLGHWVYAEYGASRQFQLSLQGRVRFRFLGQMAYDPDPIFYQVSLHSPGRKPARKGKNLFQYHDCISSQRALARRQLDLSSLGGPARNCNGFWKDGKYSLRQASQVVQKRTYLFAGHLWLEPVPGGLCQSGSLSLAAVALGRLWPSAPAHCGCVPGPDRSQPALPSGAGRYHVLFPGNGGEPFYLSGPAWMLCPEKYPGEDSPLYFVKQKAFNSNISHVLEHPVPVGDQWISVL